jgi:hypothetical protein
MQLLVINKNWKVVFSNICQTNSLIMQQNSISFTLKALIKMITAEQVIEQTKKWINDVVIECNFCPFASRVAKQQTIFFKVEVSTVTNTCLETFLQEVTQLDNNESIETSFLIFPEAFKNFNDYLAMLSVAEKLLKQYKYDGVYQLASFHPQYKFAGAPENDAANYTNRSPYPMLHLLRESSIDKALEHYSNPEAIPEQNILFARAKGLDYMKMLRDGSMKF